VKGRESVESGWKGMRGEEKDMEEEGKEVGGEGEKEGEG